MLLVRIPKSWSARSRPTCRAEGPCPPSHTPTPSFARSQCREGMWCVWKAGRAGGTWVKVTSPAHACGVRPSTYYFWPCLPSMLSIGAQPTWVHHATAASSPARACPASPPLLGPPHPAESLHTSNHSPWSHRNTEFTSLPPFHPCMTCLCTTKAFLHRISDNSQALLNVRVIREG